MKELAKAAAEVWSPKSAGEQLGPPQECPLASWKPPDFGHLSLIFRQFW